MFYKLFILKLHFFPITNYAKAKNGQIVAIFS